MLMLHTCENPTRHRLLVGIVSLCWRVASLTIIPFLVATLTHSGALALASVGLSLTIGMVVVKGLLAWHCQPLALAPVRALRPLMYMAWALREDR
jgi:hypothetical protein